MSGFGTYSSDDTNYPRKCPPGYGNMGYKAGIYFESRDALVEAGLHSHRRHAIQGTRTWGAAAIILGDEYALVNDRFETPDEFLYTGLNPAEEAETDQDEKYWPNYYLIQSIKLGFPIRVIRRRFRRLVSKHAPKESDMEYRYDGLYQCHQRKYEYDRCRLVFIFCFRKIKECDPLFLNRKPKSPSFSPRKSTLSPALTSTKRRPERPSQVTEKSTSKKALPTEYAKSNDTQPLAKKTKRRYSDECDREEDTKRSRTATGKASANPKKTIKAKPLDGPGTQRSAQKRDTERVKASNVEEADRNQPQAISLNKKASKVYNRARSLSVDDTLLSRAIDYPRNKPTPKETAVEPDAKIVSSRKSASKR
ncbi:hypothetical protein VNI00_004705 [Paramarasmius palmivorus]|uniref:YDG domain-containing protein n=1 Tax=Paramarasmius palmivorus TaxID=297713 RepID=A0AAW0DLH7_9AGAR